MGDSALIAGSVTASYPEGMTAAAVPARHSLLVRITHWITALCFFALLLSGIEILLSHPRFYWGEVGNDLTRPLFQLPVPSSRDLVPTGFHYVLPDENGWSRYLHFEAAWFLFLTGIVYVGWGLITGHFRRDLWPAAKGQSWRRVLRSHLRFERPLPAEEHRYNRLQRLAYLAVIFGLVPLVIWTGLGMSPSFVAGFPWIVTALGGTQSARTLHFFDSIALTLFVLCHVLMVARAGFLRRMRAMTLGRPARKEMP